ncbi:MAG TPA: NAD-dependent dehydratase [Deltaproteobacteria bacterium]|nr:NAD-dependent dehydratase [Deltaproteobacteria bacterium]
MKPIALVTGATGFVGNAVARTLLERGREVRVLARRNSDPQLLSGLGVEIFYGDLRKPETLAPALQGCRELYHVAAQYTFYNPDPKEIYSNNVEGTHNVLAAALKANVHRVVYTSTVGAVGIPADGTPGDEDSPITLFDCKGHYKRSKFLAEQEAMSFFRKGLPLVIVNPSAPIGARDVKPTPTGKMILDFLNRKLPAFIDTGLNLVDVDDVALGHILAAEKGRAGERYILGNQNLSLREILAELAALTGLRAPRFKIPYSLALGFAHLSETTAKLTRRPPAVEVEAVQLGSKKMFFSAAKARRELDLPQTPIRLALKKAIDWYLEHGYVREKYRRRIADFQNSSSFSEIAVESE